MNIFGGEVGYTNSACNDYFKYLFYKVIMKVEGSTHLYLVEANLRSLWSPFKWLRESVVG